MISSYVKVVLFGKYSFGISVGYKLIGWAWHLSAACTQSQAISISLYWIPFILSDLAWYGGGSWILSKLDLSTIKSWFGSHLQVRWS